MNIIDAHNHPDFLAHDLKRHLGNMDSLGIDRTWLLSWEAPATEYDPAYHRTALAGPAGPIPFERGLRYKEQAPDRFVLGYAPDPRCPEAIDRLDAAIAIHGVQVYGELKLRMMYDNLDAVRMYRFCGERGLPVVVHIDYELESGSRYPRPNWWYGGGIEAFARAVAACPQTTFVGHGPGFWAHISADEQWTETAYPAGPVVPGGRLPELLRAHANLCADLSAESGRNALARDPSFGRAFVEEFQKRLLFGRDCYDGRLLRLLRSMELKHDALQAVLWRNADRLVGAQTSRRQDRPVADEATPDTTRL